MLAVSAISVPTNSKDRTARNDSRNASLSEPSGHAASVETPNVMVIAPASPST